MSTIRSGIHSEFNTPVPKTLEQDGADHERVEYFIAAPADIGPVLWSTSTLKAGRRPIPFLRRVAIAFSAAFVPATIWIGAMQLREPDPHMNLWMFGQWVAIFTLFLVPIFSTIAWYMTIFEVRCAYVGESGAVQYFVRGSLKRRPKIQHMLFTNAAALYSSHVRVYKNGMYAGSFYGFRWVDSKGQMCLEVKGSYQFKKGLTRKQSPFHFAAQAELRWTEILNARSETDIAERGYIRFPLLRGGFIEIGAGKIVFQIRRRRQEWNLQEIGSMTLWKGQFLFKRRDAGSIFRRGKISVPYSEIGNARLFLIMMDQFFPNLLTIDMNALPSLGQTPLENRIG